MIDLSRLYRPAEPPLTGGICRLCEMPQYDHEEGCPGALLDNLQVQVEYAGDRCTRGCCGSTHGTVERDTRQAALEAAASKCEDATCYLNATLRWVSTFDEETVTDEVLGVVKQRRDAAAAKEAAAQAAKKAAEAEGRRAAALAALEAERGDLTADAYERRKKALAVVS